MNKEQANQKKMQDAQIQAFKQKMKEREQQLLNNEFMVREWKAEVERMRYTMEYEQILPEYQKLQADKQEAYRKEMEEAVNKQADEPTPEPNIDVVENVAEKELEDAYTEG